MSPGASELYPPPLTLSFPATTSGWCLQVETPAQRVGLLRIIPVPVVFPGDGNNFSNNSSSCGTGGGGGGRCEEGVTPPSASQPNLPGSKHWKLPGTFPTLCSVAKRSRPGLSLWPLHGASKQACSWLGRLLDPRCSGHWGRAWLSALLGACL